MGCLKYLIVIFICFAFQNLYSQTTDTNNYKSIEELKSKVLNLEEEIKSLNSKIDMLIQLYSKEYSVKNVNEINAPVAKSNSNNSLEVFKEEKVKETKQQSSSNGQCQATTKKGTRCSRSVRSNGYCWQHGG